MHVTIARLYDVTSQRLTVPVDHCSCGCHEHIDFQKIESVSRERLDFETLGKYADKALTTVGEVEHYQYFLPRICEMVWEGKTPCGVHFCLLSKLEYGKFWEWPAPLKNVVVDFLRALLEKKKRDQFFDLDEEEVRGVEELVQKGAGTLDK